MGSLQYDIQEFMRPSLESQWKHLEKEMASNEFFMEGAYASVKSFVTDGVDFLASVFKGKDGHHVVQFSRDRTLERQVPELDAVALNNVKLRQPPGLNVMLDKWILALSDSQGVVDSLDKNVLTPSLRVFSYLISNPETLNASTPALALTKVQIPDLTRSKKTLAACLKENDDRVQTGFFDLYKNANEYSSCEKDFEKTVQAFMRVRRKDIVKATDQIVEIVDKIFKKVEDDKDPTELSPQMSQMLSRLTWDIAQCVEFYSVHSYNMMSTSMAMMDNHNVLSDLVKNQ